LTSETNADGVFEIRDVPNGRWAIQAQKDGFVVSPISLRPLIEASAGRSVTAPEIRLDRGGAITGRVLDARGNPISRVAVRTTQLRRLPNGTVQTLGGSYSSVQTNDLGEFRLSGLVPGEHYVVAQPPPRPMGIGFATTAQAPASSTYVATFFPGTPDAAIASPVTVARGGTTRAIDFSMQSVPAYQVSGLVVDAGGRPVNGAIVRLAPRQALLGMSIQGGPTGANGRFRVTNVPAGAYRAMAAVPTITRTANGGTSGSLSFGAAARPGAAPEVTIQGDVTGLRVVVSQP
jgi:protocatechuate 3,4-dioxygenase beta subunit